MTLTFSAAELRRWLVDYLIENVGCDARDIDFDASFSDQNRESEIETKPSH